MYNHPNSGQGNMRFSGQHSGNGYQNSFQTGTYQQAAPHQQYQGQQMPGGGNGQQFSQLAAPSANTNINMKQHPSLIQPPALNVQQTINTNSQFLGQRGGGGQVAESNHDNSEFDMYPQQQGQWNNEYQIAAAFWQQKCYDMLSKFEWFFQRFEILKNDYGGLSEQIQKLDTQDDWHMFQQHHDQFYQKIIQLDQELAALMGENQQLYQQKMTHDSQNMWEQRYQELLGNFKSLQQQMAQRQNQPQGGVPIQQYQNLQDQMNQLHYQYNQVVTQLQKQQGLNYQQEYQMQLNQYQNQIQKYKLNMNTIHNENVELQNMLMELQDKNKMLTENYQGNNVDKQKFQELAQLIHQKEMEIQALQQDFNNRGAQQENVYQYQKALKEKHSQNQELRRNVIQLEVQLQHQKNNFQQAQQQIATRVQQHYQKQFIQNQQKIKQLQKKLSQSQNPKSKSIDNSTKVQSLQKKLAFSSEQITNLNDTLKLKNKELSQLRDSTYQVQKLKQKQAQYEKVVGDRDRLSQNIRKKNIQIDNLHRQLQALTKKVNEVSNKRQQYSTRNLMAEIQDLTQQIRRNESQILKLKNVIELKEQYCLKLQEDIRKINDKYIFTQQTLFSEREEWRQKEIKFNNKTNSHQNRIKNLDYQFNLQLRDTLQKEINVLRRQNVEKQQSIRKCQENQIMLTSKLAIFQKQKGNFDQDMALMRKKQKQLEGLNQNLARRFRQLQNTYLKKDQELQNLKMNAIGISSQLATNKARIQDQKQSLKGKNKVIEELQKQISEHLGQAEIIDRLKVQNSKLKIAVNKSEEELEKLKLQAQSRLANSKLRLSASRGLQQKQQNPLLNQLQRENQYLKEEMAKMLQNLSVQKVVSNKQIEVQQKKSTTTTVNLNKRLNQFNSKLQFAIGQGEGHPGLQHSRSQKLVNFWETQRKELIDRYQVEIRDLKDQLRQNRLGRGSQVSQNTMMDGSKRQTYAGVEIQRNKQQAQFYKKKAKQLQSRNEHLIKINEQIKQKVNGVLRIKQSSATNQFFKEQNKQLQSQIETLKAKLKKTLEENKEYRIELSVKNSKTAQQYQYRLLQQQLMVQDLKRKITYLQTQKMPIIEEKLRESHRNYKNSSEFDVRSSANKKESQQIYIPESNKYGGIQEEFQSVLGNLRGSTNTQGGRHITSVNFSSHTYGDSRIDDPHQL